MVKSKKAPVTSRALVQRLNRALAKDGQKLKAARGERMRQEMGDYFAVDTDRNVVTAMHIDLEAWGRETGALKPYEELVDDE